MVSAVPADPVSYRFRQGETIATADFSSVVMTYYARFRVAYDDGNQELVSIDDFTTGSTRAGENAKTGWVARMDGTVLSGSAHISGGTANQPKRGQTYVRAFVSSSTDTLTVGTVLFQGYLYRGFSPVLGMNVEPGPEGGHGNYRTVTGTNPAANTEVSEAVPANALWRIIAFSVVLVTDANVANRSTNLVADDGTTANRFWFILNPGAHAASLTRTHLFLQGSDTVSPVTSPVTTDTAVVFHVGNLPNVLLPPASRIRTNTTNIQVGDDYAAPIYMIEEWIDP